MAEPINLNKARKAREREQAKAQAQENRVRFGRGKAEKQVSKLEAERAAYERLRDTAGARHPQTALAGLLYARDLRAANRIREAGMLDSLLRPPFEKAFAPDSAFRSELDSPQPR